MAASISIVIPTYNGGKFLSEAIRSALCQTVPADEILISDDNSSDNTLDICRQFGNQIKIFKNPDGPSGFVNGWNNAIAHASSEYISILHQDDILAPNFIERIQEAIAKYPNAKHLFASCNYIDVNGEILPRKANYMDGKIHLYSGQEYANAYIRLPYHIHRCPGVVTHRDIFSKCTYREETGHIADNDFFLRAGNYTDVVGILEPLASYREHESSETGHLDFLTLNRRLLNDYHYQLEHASENPLLSDEIIETFRKWEAEYIHRLIVFGLKNRELGFVKTAVSRWFTFKKGCKFGNIAYDMQSLKRKIKERIRRAHAGYLHACAHRAPEFVPEGEVLIIAPHPDDEVIGCGGLIARLVAEGRTPHILILSGGGGSHRGCCNISEEEVIAHRRQLTHNALSLLSVPERNIHFANLPDGHIKDHIENNLTHSRRDRGEDDSQFSILNPQFLSQFATILVPHWSEGWPDHTCVKELVENLTQSRRERGEDNSQFSIFNSQLKSHSVIEYLVWGYYYNTWRGFDWSKARAIRMSAEEHKKKLAAIEEYVAPIAPCGNPWSGKLPKVFLDANRAPVELYFTTRE